MLFPLYRSKDGEPPKINKLGSKSWITLKNNAKRKVKDIAKDLIQLYAKRRAAHIIDPARQSLEPTCEGIEML